MKNFLIAIAFLAIWIKLTIWLCYDVLPDSGVLKFVMVAGIFAGPWLLGRMFWYRRGMPKVDPNGPIQIAQDSLLVPLLGLVLLVAVGVGKMALEKSPSSGLVARVATAQTVATPQLRMVVIEQPTVAPVPTMQPQPVVAQPETNGADVGLVAVDQLGRALEREQRQNETLANRPNADNVALMVALILFGIIGAGVIIRRLGSGRQSQPNISIGKPDSPEQLTNGVYAVVDGQVVRLGDVPQKAKQKQLKSK